MEDEEIFQPTQVEEYEDNDDTFTSVAAEIAVRKIKLEQKKENLRILVQKLKKITEERKRAEVERNNLAKENEEIQQQTALKLSNLKKLEETKSSLETALKDITSKVNFEAAETKRKADSYRAKIQDANDTLESYLEVYNSFPLAIKLKKVEEEFQIVGIELSKTKNEIRATNERTKLMKEITQKRENAKFVNLAKLYLELQEKTRKTRELQNKQKELLQLIKDNKSGKFESFQSKTTSTLKNVCQTQDPKNIEPKRTLESLQFQFKMPSMQIFSPPSATNTRDSTTNRTNLLSWESLLEGITSFNFAKKANSTSTNKADPKPADLMHQVQEAPEQSLVVENISKVQVDNSKQQLSGSKKTACDQSPFQPLQKKYRNAIVSTSQTNLEAGGKRKSNDLENTFSGKENVKQTNQPAKKMSIMFPNVSKISNHPIKQHGALMQKKQENKHTKEQEIRQHEKEQEYAANNDCNTNQEKSKRTDSTNTVHNIHTLLSSLNHNKSKPSIMFQNEAAAGTDLSGNLACILSVKQTGAQQQKKPELSKSINSSVPSHPANNNTQIGSNYKANTDHNSLVENPSNDERGSQPDIGMMSVSSPPDLVPMENNSQPICQTKPLSQYSDFHSPLELNSAEKALYEKFEAESPGYVYNSASPVIQQLQKGEAVVRSQYFPNVDTSSKDDIPNVTDSPSVSDEYQHMPFSPPINYVLSPPSANLDKENSVEMSFLNSATKNDGNKSSDGGFNFRFGSKESNTSLFFSLF